jgi:hypothetical protein
MIHTPPDEHIIIQSLCKCHSLPHNKWTIPFRWKDTAAAGDGTADWVWNVAGAVLQGNAERERTGFGGIRMSMRQSRWSREVSLITAWLLVAPSGLQAGMPGQAAPAQTGQGMLNIVVVKGDGAINNIKLRTAREVVVQVEDENHKPVAGASVAFLLPNSGPGATFADGSTLYTGVTDQSGRVAVSSMKPNQTAGSFQINVTASYQGLRAVAVIGQKNILPLAIAGMSVGVFAAVVGAAATVATVLAIKANSGSSTPAVSNSARVSIGAPTLP